MDPELTSYDFAATVRRTGIDPVRIRFLQREFRGLFRIGNDALQTTHFDARELDLLRRLDRWIFTEKRSLQQVRRDLAREQSALRIVAVTSGKGGVGKTTVALNLAVAMAGGGLRTLLFDADMGMANVHVFAGLNPSRTVADLIRGRAPLEDVLLDGPGGIRVLPGGSGMTDLADLDLGMTVRLGRDLMRLGDLFDIIVVDTGAGAGARVVEFLRIADDIVVVVTPDIASTLDAYGIVKIVCESGLPGRIRLLVNMVRHADEPQMVLARIGGCAQRFLNRQPGVLGWLAQDSALQQANQQRCPLMLSQPESDGAGRFMQMAANLAAPACGGPPSERHRGERMAALAARFGTVSRPQRGGMQMAEGVSHGRAQR